MPQTGKHAFRRLRGRTRRLRLLAEAVLRNLKLLLECHVSTLALGEAQTRGMLRIAGNDLLRHMLCIADDLLRHTLCIAKFGEYRLDRHRVDRHRVDWAPRHSGTSGFPAGNKSSDDFD